MDDLEKLIDAHPLEVRCAHCGTLTIRPLGFLRDHREIHCVACDEMIVLGTSDLRALIRDRSRQLRALNESLYTNVHGWKAAVEPPGSRPAEPAHATAARQALHRDRVASMLRIARSVDELLGQCLRASVKVEKRACIQAAIALHTTLRALFDATRDTAGCSDLGAALGTQEGLLRNACLEIGLEFGQEAVKRHRDP